MLNFSNMFPFIIIKVLLLKITDEMNYILLIYGNVLETVNQRKVSKNCNPVSDNQMLQSNALSNGLKC